MRVVSVVLVAFCLCAIEAKLVQVQIVHRHGARQPLGKHAYNTSDEELVAPLFPGGVEQLRALGRYVRETYVVGQKIEGVSVMEPGVRDVGAFSSNLRRTMMSSRAFLDGLYGGKIVGTLVFGDRENDWVLRGYAICPVLVERFREFLESAEFREKEESDGGFVEGLGKRLGMEGGLENVFNVYDEFVIVRNEGFGMVGYGGGVDPLSDEEFERLKGLADWYESTRYHFGLHNIHVAGGLLRQIEKRMADKIANTREAAPFHIVEYSAHYPTILSLWASLRARNSEKGPVFPANEIPGFGAALIFELHKDDDGTYRVRMLWYKGDGTGEEGDTIQPVPVAIGRGQCSEANKDKGCKYDEMARLLTVDDYGQETFCRDCGSKAAVCKQYEPEKTGGTTSETSGEVNTSTGKWIAGIVGGVAGLIVGLAVALAYMTCVAKRKQRGYEMRAGSFDEEIEPPDHYDGHVEA